MADDLKDIQQTGYVENDLDAGGNIVITQTSNAIITAILQKKNYDINELRKSVNTDVSELRPIIPEELERTISIGEFEDAQNRADLFESQNNILQNNLDDNLELINRLLQDSGSLSISNESLIIESTFFKNEHSKVIGDVNKLSTDLANTLGENINLRIEVNALTAQNATAISENITLKSQLEIATGKNLTELTFDRSVIGEGGTSIDLQTGQVQLVTLSPLSSFIGKSTYIPNRTTSTGSPLLGSQNYSVSLYKNQPSPNSTKIESDSKDYILKNVSTVKVQITLIKDGANPGIFSFGVNGGQKIGDKFAIDPNQSLRLTLNVSKSGTETLFGGPAGRVMDYLALLTIFAESDNMIPESKSITVTVKRESR